MYKLIAIDLDGTLLNKEKRITDVNKEYIGYAIKKGVKVVICSGRIFAGAKAYAKEIKTMEPLIACNGAIIKDIVSGEELYSDSLQIEDCFKIIDICKKEDIYFHAYVGDTMYTERLNFSSLFYSNKNKELPKEDRVDIRCVKSVKKVLEAKNKSTSKIVVISEDLNHLMFIRKQVEIIKSVEVMSSNFNNFEIVNSGVNKGNALKFLAEKLGIKREEVIAIGDNENDHSMISYAGLGIAMGNAENTIKEIADFVTFTNDQNGVAEVIKNFIL